MSEMQLELKIASDASAAEKALSALAGALGRLRNAVSKGLGLDKVAEGLSRVSSALSTGVSEDSVSRLERVATAMERIKSVGSVKVNVGGQAKDMDRAMVRANDEAVRVRDTNEQIAVNVREIGEQYAAATSKLDVMRMKAEGLAMRLAAGVDSGTFDSHQIGSHISRIQDLNTAIANASRAETAAENDVIAGARRMASEYVNAMSPIELMQMRAAAMQEKLAQGIAAGWDDSKIAAYAAQIQRLAANIDNARMEMQALKDAAAPDGAKTSATAIADAMDQTGQKAETAQGPVRRFADAIRELNIAGKLSHTVLGRLIGQFWRIAKMRMLRYVIREIAKSMKEGLENYKQYSKAIGGDYYKAVTSLSDATLKMKNAIGAALAPAIQMLIPFVQQLISGFINLLNIVNQFLALLHGQSTWSQAIDVSSEAFEETQQGAQGAHKAMKELLADFDELNIIQSESGGGAGGSAGKDLYDYTQMFQETSQFDSKIKGLVLWLKEHLELVKGIAISIGAAILAWKIGRLFNAGFTTLIGLALAFYGAVSMITGILDQWKNGVNLDNMTQTLTGLGVLAAGLFIIFGSVGGAIGLIVGGIAAMIAPLKELAETGTMTKDAMNQVAIALGAVAVGALLLGGWIPALIAAVAAIGVAIYANWDSIKAWWDNTAVPFLENIGFWVYSNVVAPIIDWWNTGVAALGAIWIQIKTGFANLWENQVVPIAHAVNSAVVQPIVRWFGDLGRNLSTIWETISITWNNIWVNDILPVVNWIDQEIIHPIGRFFSALWGSITNDPNNNLAVWWDDFWRTSIMPAATWVYTDIIKPIVDYFATAWDAIEAAWNMAVTWWDEFWKKLVVENIYTGVVLPIVEYFVGLWDGVKAAWGAVEEWWNGFWGGIAAWGTNVYTSIAEPISNTLTGMWAGVEDAYNTVAEWWNGFWENTIRPIVDWIDANIIQQIVGFFSGLWGTITGDPNNNLESWFAGFWENNIYPIVTWVDTNIVQRIAGFFSGLWGTITGDKNNNLAMWWANLWNNEISGVVSNINGQIITPIKGFFTGLWENITNSSVVSGVVGWWNGLWTNTLKGPVEGIKANIIDKITGFFTGLWGTITGDESNNLVEWWNGIFGENGSLKVVADKVEDVIITPIKNFFSGLWRSIMDLGKDEEGNGGVEAWWNGIFGEGGVFAGVVGTIESVIIDPIKTAFSGLWASIMGTDENGETKSIGDWWNGLWTETFGGVIDSINQTVIVPIATNFYSLKNSISDAANKAYDAFKTAWTNISNWFYDNVSMPVANFFIDAMNGVIGAINTVIDALNSIHITIPGVTVFGQKLWDDIPVGISGIANLSYIPRWEPRAMANGGLVNTGEMFIAREAGPELIGRIGNRTAVANNDQIVNGISNGVAEGMGRANEETDALLGQAVSLLSQILRKTGTLQPSAALGRTIKQSSEMYARSGG